MSTITVVKRDGTREPFDANKINLALVTASEGLPDQISKVVEVASQLQLTLFDGITSEQLDEAVIHTALQNVKDDPDFDKIAARLLLKNLYKNILGDYTTPEQLKKLHEKHLAKYLKAAVKDGLLDARLVDGRFDLKVLAEALGLIEHPPIQERRLGAEPPLRARAAGRPAAEDVGVGRGHPMGDVPLRHGPTRGEV